MDPASVLVHFEKKRFWFGVSVEASQVGELLHFFGQLYPALGANLMSQLFNSVFFSNWNIIRVYRDHEIKSFFKPMRTIDDKLGNGKDPVHRFDRQGEVYFVPCGDCDQKLFGEKKGHSTHARKNISTI